MSPGADVPLCVLLVDDQPRLIETVAEVLRELGAIVATASSLVEVRHLLPSFAPGLVITDLRMPGGSGLEVLAEVQRWRPGTPVVGVTGDSAAEGVAGAGFFRVLQKPLSIDVLADVLTAVRGA